MLLPRLWIKIKIQISSLYSFSSTESAYFHFSIAFLFIVVLHRHLELFTGHIIDSRCLFHVNFTSYQCQSIIYQRLGIVRPKLSNFDSCATCPPSSTPRHPADPCQTTLLTHSILQVTIFENEKIWYCTFYSGKIIVDADRGSWDAPKHFPVTA